MTNKRARLVALLAALATTSVLTACGSDSADSTDGSGGGSGDGAFPVTLDTAMGEVTIDEKPQNVVVTNGTMADAVYGLGVEPVAMDLDGGAEAGFESYPWLKDVVNVDSIDEELVGDDTKASPEAIAKYEPDLILAMPFEVQDKAIYEQLSSIAPVVTGVDANDSWDVRLETVGKALGMEDEAAAVEEETRASAAKVTEQAPNLEGATYYWVRYDADGSLVMGNGSVLELFGLQPAEQQDNSQNAEAGISQENLEQLDADVLGVWCYADCAPLKADPRFGELPAAQHDLVIWPDMALAIAMNGPGPHSIPWLVEQMGPQLIAGSAAITA